MGDGVDTDDRREINELLSEMDDDTLERAHLELRRLTRDVENDPHPTYINGRRTVADLNRLLATVIRDTDDLTTIKHASAVLDVLPRASKALERWQEDLPPGDRNNSGAGRD
ncbi:hypothetical protein [Halosimplex carlsbadense]|uniref:hypothetical protein n=1 Tax=Halosimplex carlsbadense TaxID=171164 RepID=UPI0006781C6B|nr:hypothetical protein [Halosimplex carlsbadense]